jgi:hypothetical protein
MEGRWNRRLRRAVFTTFLHVNSARAVGAAFAIRIRVSSLFHKFAMLILRARAFAV